MNADYKKKLFHTLVYSSISLHFVIEAVDSKLIC